MNSLNTIELSLTNAALGAALDIARDWITSDNGNNVMAAKSMLKFELEHKPTDPRQIRHAIKLPKSLAGQLDAPYSQAFKENKRIPKAVKVDIRGMSWTATGASGNVRAEALGWFLEKSRYWAQTHPTPSVQRAAKKFVSTYTAPYEATQKLITSSLPKGEPALDFTEAVHGRDGSEGEATRLDREPTGRAEGPVEWQSGQFRDVMNLPRQGGSPVIWFGGKFGKKTPDPGEWRTVLVTSLGSGKYQLTDMGTHETVLTASLTSQIHWAPAELAELPVVEGQAPAEPGAPEREEHQVPEEKPAAEPRLFEPPANWVELAEEGDTPQARAYWTRRCEEYRRTGK
ncbi:hypothetical protein ACIQUL_36170 [Streptomyces sp. NPDC090303]|uniref:hypothetical protein n=1 Tax=Streptomyces sp. NPDC090303 TaxID=3365960 RepID=UPI00381C6BA7